MEQKSDAKVIEGLIQALEAKGKSPSTIQTYNRIIRNFMNWLKTYGGDLNQLTRIDIQQYIHYLEEKGNSASTIENKFAALSFLARHLDAEEILQHIRRPEVRKTQHIAPKSLDRNERNRVLREVERTRNLRNIALVYLFIYSGLRVSEIAALNREDIIIGQRKGSVTVRKGKGNIARTVPLPIEARLHLSQYLKTRTDRCAALFLSNYQQRISIRSIQRVLEKFSVHPHALRHTYCRELVGAGVDIATVAELAGHNDINITRRYSKPSAIELEHTIQKVFG